MSTITKFLDDTGWKLIGHGISGSLWSCPANADMVAVPHDLQPHHWEWDGVIRRIATATLKTEQEILDQLNNA